MATLYNKLKAPAISVFLDKHGNRLTNDQLNELAKAQVSLEGFSAEQINDYKTALAAQEEREKSAIEPEPIKAPLRPRNMPPHRAPNAPAGDARG